MGSLNAGIRAKISNLFSAESGFARKRAEHIPLFVGSKTFTDAHIEFKKIFYDEEK